MVPLCLMWTICCERNRRTFDGIGIAISRCKHLFLRSLYQLSIEGSILYSFLDFWILVLLIIILVGLVVYFLCTSAPIVIS